MVGGRFMCIGTPQHIKNRYGKGYIVTIRLEADKDKGEAVDSYMKTSFPDVQTIEKQLTILKYRVGIKNKIPLGKLISTIRTSQQDGLARDFSITQASLDDIFVEFAREERANTEGNRVNHSLDEEEIVIS